MPTRHEEIAAALAAPFDPSEIKARNQGGKKIEYITARTAANRLDEVLGFENWRQEFRETRNGLICRLWFRLGSDQEWTWKEDGGGYAGMPDEDNNVKSGLSDAFKRAAAMLGVGRSLYRDGIPHYGEVPGVVPASSLPSPPRDRQPDRRPAERRPPPAPARESDFDGSPPRTGRQLFRWIKEQEKEYGPGLLEMVNDWGRGNRLPNRMVDWPDSAAAMAYEAALHMLPADGVTSDEQRHYEESLAH